MSVSKGHPPAHPVVRRRGFLQAAASLALAVAGPGIARAGDETRPTEGPLQEVQMTDLPATPTTKVTVQRRGPIVLIGLNRPHSHNRIDPETFSGLGKAFY